MRKYEVLPGFSITTKIGMAHCGAVITADHFTDPEGAEKMLEGYLKKGKLKIAEAKKKKGMAGGASKGPTKEELIKCREEDEKELLSAMEMLENAKSKEDIESARSRINDAEELLKKANEALEKI